MSTTPTVPKRKLAYDPARQWGLKPEPAEGTKSTYVFSGHVVGGPGSDSRSLFLTENIGREGQAKAQSKIKRVDEDRELQRLLERDKEGMRAVVKAREAVMEMECGSAGHEGGKGRKQKKTDKKDTKRSTKKPSKARDGNAKTPKDNDQDENESSDKPTMYYPASVVKNLGFDPAAVKLGQRKVEDLDLQAKVCQLRVVVKTF
jgi:minichromosome maintenance protein 10